MNPKELIYAEVDDAGRVILPAEVVRRYGLLPGAQVAFESGPDELRLLRPVSQLHKIYVEPTNACNLDCVTCMRNVWDEPLGKMTRGGLRAHPGGRPRRSTPSRPSA